MENVHSIGYPNLFSGNIVQISSTEVKIMCSHGHSFQTQPYLYIPCITLYSSLAYHQENLRKTEKLSHSCEWKCNPLTAGRLGTSLCGGTWSHHHICWGKGQHRNLTCFPLVTRCSPPEAGPGLWRLPIFQLKEENTCTRILCPLNSRTHRIWRSAGKAFEKT